VRYNPIPIANKNQQTLKKPNNKNCQLMLALNYITYSEREGETKCNHIPPADAAPRSHSKQQGTCAWISPALASFWWTSLLDQSPQSHSTLSALDVRTCNKWPCPHASLWAALSTLDLAKDQAIAPEIRLSFPVLTTPQVHIALTRILLQEIRKWTANSVFRSKFRKG